MQKYRATESQEQQALFEWRDRAGIHLWPELKWLHANVNGAKLSWIKNKKGKRYSKEAVRLKKEGLLSGVPDMFLPLKRHGFSGLYIELKKMGGKTSQTQIEFINFVSTQGFCAVVCEGWEKARHVIQWYMKDGN